MVIKIPVPKRYSNKTKTQPEIDHQADTSPPNGIQPASSLIPFVDRLTVLVKPHNHHAAKAIHQAIVGSWEDKEFLQSAKKTGGFKRAHHIVVPKSEHRPHFLYDYDEKAATRLRFDFNPARLTLDGMVSFHGQLKSIMDGGWEYVIGGGMISRIDITVDLPSLRMDEFLFMPKQMTTKSTWWKQGLLESVLLGNPKGNQTVIYNKKIETLNKGKPWEGKTTIRIERRLRNPSPSALKDLSKLSNPWVGTTMAVNHPSPAKDMKPNEWSMFGDSVRERGVDQALALLPKERKARYRAHLKENSLTWWDPAAIWANWPTFLQQSKLVDAAYFSGKA